MCEPHVNIEMMFQDSAFDCSCRRGRENLGGPVATCWASLHTGSTICRLSSSLLNFHGGMSGPHVSFLEGNLVSFPGPVMSECSWHVLKHVHLSILNPIPIFHGVDPERWPVLGRITWELIIEFNLGKTFSSNWKDAGVLGVLINTCILVYRWAGVLNLDEVWRF